MRSEEPLPTMTRPTAGASPVRRSERDGRPSDELPADAGRGLRLGPDVDPDRFALLGPGLRGGEGILWRARYAGALTAPLDYAIKQIRPPVGADPSWPTPDDRKRWQDQRHLLASMRHDHLVPVHDFFLGPPPHSPGQCPAVDGLEFAVPYLVMDFIDGPSLDTSVRRGDGDLITRLRWVRAIADGLTALHSSTRTAGNPMLHRDVKPANCVLHEDRGAVLVDFGTLRTLDDGYDARGMHTRHYTAPEALEDPSAPRDAATDLYSLGAVAWFCVVGDDPPAADEHHADAILRAELVSAVHRWGVQRADEMVDHLLRMLASDPRIRPTRPARWADELLTLAKPAPGWTAQWGARLRGDLHGRTGLVAAAVAATIALTGAAVAFLPEDELSSGVEVPVTFTPFGQSFAAFEATVDGDALYVSPPDGPDRFSQLWGFHAPGEACATTVSFDVKVGEHDSQHPFGFAVGPRSALAADQPEGHSIQYEWQVAEYSERPGSYVRPAEMPGGAWAVDRADQAGPVPAPNLEQRRHVEVRAVGTTMTMSVDGVQQAQYRLDAVECGGVTLRAWGAPVTFTDVRVEQT